MGALANHRSSHIDRVPNVGGAVVVLASTFSLLFFSDILYREDAHILFSAFAVLLITGVVDDFSPLPVGMKFLGQFIPSIFIVSSFEPNALTVPFFLSVDLPYIVHYIFWVLFFVAVTNAFNLIDGIDGLAILLGTAGCFMFAFLFYSGYDPALVVFAMSVAGGLGGLMWYNTRSKNKIFLGDTGALLIGGVLSYFIVNYLQQIATGDISRHFLIVLGVVFLPFADMVRVTIKRLLKGRSPFAADRTHIHHIFIDQYRFSHLKTSFVLLLIHLGFVLLVASLGFINQHFPLVNLLVLCAVYYVLTEKVLMRKKHQHPKSAE